MAKKDTSIEINCTSCSHPVSFSLKALATLPCVSKCDHCGKQFGIDSGLIAKQIKLFVELCQQIKASEEILGKASVAVNIGSQVVRIPYKLLLTRLRSTLDLDVGGQNVVVSYRTDPMKVATDLAEIESTL
jgi:hypothetical protein